jgi:hypothetical protein
MNIHELVAHLCLKAADIANENTNGTIGFALLVVTAGKDCSVIVGPITSYLYCNT